MSIYDEMREIADEVIGEFQQGTVLYVAVTAGTGGTRDAPSDPTTDPTTIPATVRAVSSKYVDGSHIVQSDRQITFAGGIVSPKHGGHFLIDGVRYTIIETMPQPAAGDPVSWTVIVRR